MNNLRIKEMNDDEKPIEKMLKKGAKSLSNAELIAILIRTGNRSNNAVTLSSKILKKSVDGIRGLRDMSVEELCEIDGIGKTKASILKAAFELGDRVACFMPEKHKIENPWDVYAYYIEEMRYLKKEVFKVILLNTKNEIICDINVSVGSLNTSIVHPREVFSEPVKKSANSVILMHNHPSGNPSPSNEDKSVTLRLQKSGEILGISVLDHIIIGDGTYYSLKENGDF